MQFSDLPGYIVLPFADSGGKTTIPVTTATPGRASLTEGFPALNRTPIASGGIPPDGTDMNGILFEVSAWSRWTSAGAPVVFDAAFSTAVGGYPRCSVLTNDALNGQWFSLVNNNTNDPDTTGTGWMNLMPQVAAITATGTLTIRQQGLVTVDATAGNISLTLPGASSALGLPLAYTFVRTDATGNSVTILRAGSNTIEGLASMPLPVGGRLTLTSDGSAAWRLTAVLGVLGATSIQSFTSSGTFTVPAGIFRVRATVTGAGGGGSGCNVGQGGSGGGAGSTAIEWIGVAPGDTVSVTVGTAGTAGPSGGSPGGTGGTSSFGAFCSAVGGLGGDVTNGGGIGGTAMGGDVNVRGGDGGDGGGPSDPSYGGNGGASYWGGGGRAGSTGGGGGLPGRAYGSGGGGSYDRSGGASAGGAGAAGIVTVEW